MMFIIKFMYKKHLKRFLDIFFSMVLLIILTPFLLLIALFVRIFLGSPVIFQQERPGLNEKIFTIYKFRTMNDKKDAAGNLLPDSVRLTKFGSFLRGTSLDELPELINIFKGEMSFIGPRPLLVRYLPLYNAEQKRRHNIVPGLTGLAQINGRNVTTWPARFRHDVYYVDNLSFWLDCKIFFKTIIKTLRREDINLDTNTTMTPFMGDE